MSAHLYVLMSSMERDKSTKRNQTFGMSIGQLVSYVGEREEFKVSTVNTNITYLMTTKSHTYPIFIKTGLSVVC